jgi:hypothetical protein
MPASRLRPARIERFAGGPIPPTSSGEVGGPLRRRTIGHGTPVTLRDGRNGAILALVRFTQPVWPIWRPAGLFLSGSACSFLVRRGKQPTPRQAHHGVREGKRTTICPKGSPHVPCREFLKSDRPDELARHCQLYGKGCSHSATVGTGLRIASAPSSRPKEESRSRPSQRY